MNFFDTADNCTHSAIMSAAHRKKPHPGHSRGGRTQTDPRRTSALG
jgi:hypothetical protein